MRYGEVTTTQGEGRGVAITHNVASLSTQTDLHLTRLFEYAEAHHSPTHSGEGGGKVLQAEIARRCMPTARALCQDAVWNECEKGQNCGAGQKRSRQGSNLRVVRQQIWCKRSSIQVCRIRPLSHDSLVPGRRTLTISNK